MGDGAARDGRDRPLPPLAVLVLGLLDERPMHPYEMLQTTAERREDRLVKFRPGTLYHTVDRLHGRDLIEVAEVVREGNRPERTVYAITGSGREALRRSLEEIVGRHPTEYPEIYLALSEAHALPRRRVVELLGERLELMRADLADVQAAADAFARRGVAEMFVLDTGCRLATLTAQTEFVAALLDRLAAGELPWLDDPDSPHRDGCCAAPDVSAPDPDSTADTRVIP